MKRSSLLGLLISGFAIVTLGAACGDGEADDIQGSGGGGGEVTCSDSQAICDDSCTSINSDPDHCGACDVSCGEGEGCLAGECANFGCGTGQVTCNEQCVDPQTNRDNCGSCDSACASGEQCTEGQCVPSCGAGLIECDGACVDPLFDRNFCGATDCSASGAGGAGGASSGSGAVCESGLVCDSGECKNSCGTDRIECGGSCIDPLGDQNYCGATDCSDAGTSGDVCSTEEACSVGVCREFVFKWGSAREMQTVGRKAGSNEQGLGTDDAGNATMVWREFGTGDDASVSHLLTREYDFASRTPGPIHQLDNASQSTGNPWLSVASNGDAAVSWTEVLPSPAIGNSVFVSAYSAMAEEWTTPVRVDDTSEVDRFETTIAADSQGGIWVAWNEDVGSGEFRTARRQFVDGSWGNLGTNPERIEVLNGYTDEDGSSFGQKLVSNADGDVGLAWYDYNWAFDALNEDKKGKATMFVTVYDAASKAWSAVENVRGSPTNWSRWGAHDLAIDSTGDTHVAWATWDGNPPTPKSRLTYRKFDAGNAAWDTVVDLPTINSYHRDPQISVDDSGEVLIVSYSEPDPFFYPHLYTNTPPEDRNFDITATFYDGSPTATTVIATSSVTNANRGPDPVAARDQDGNAHVVWSRAASTGGEVHTVRYESQFGWEAFSTLLASGQGGATNPAVAAAPRGRAFATYYQAATYNFVSYD